MFLSEIKLIMNITHKLIGEYVADDFRTASVFSKHKIDFCCNGNRTINEACKKKGIDSQLLLKELENVMSDNTISETDYKSWSLDFLAQYIENTHHRFVEEKTPIIRQFLDKLCKIHGTLHPELFEINKLFSESGAELASHMKKEELILFPFIKKMVRTKEDGTEIDTPHFGTVENPISMMKEEHENEGRRYRAIAKLTNEYTPPLDACNTYKVTFKMLKEFEQDLHLHIHLENNILFPKAVKMEQNFN